MANDIAFDVKVDDTGAVSAAQRVKQANESASRSFEQIDKSAKQSSLAFYKIRESYNAASYALAEFAAEQVLAGRSIDENGNVLTAYGVKAKGLTNELASLKLAFNNASDRSEKMAAMMDSLTGRSQKASTVIATQTTVATNLADSLSEAAGGYSLLGEGADQLNDKLSQANSTLANAISRQISLGNTVDDNNRVIDKNGNELVEATAALKRYAEQANSARANVTAVNTAMARMSDSADVMSGRFVKLSKNSGQAGIQIQQFVGQVQAGTSPLLAFSQQAADLGIVLGAPLVGAIVGIGASLAMAFVPSMMDSSDSTKDLVDKLKELQENAKLTSNQLEFLAQVEAEEGREKDKSIAKIKELIAEKEAQIATEEALARATSVGSNQTGRRAVKNKEYQASVAELRRELVQLRAELDTAQGKTGGVTDEQQDRIDAARESARRRVQILTSSVAVESELLNAATRNRVAVETGAMTELEEAQRNSEAKRIASLKTQADARVLQIQDEAARIKESEVLSGEEKAALLDNLRLAELNAINNFEGQKTSLEEKGKRARLLLAEQEKQAKLSMLSSMFGNLSSLMNTESRKMFEIGKAAAVSQAVVDGYAAVSKTMAATPYPWNIPLAAAQSVASFAQVKGIMSTSYGSAGTGQSYSGGQVATNTTTTSAGAQAPNRTFDIRGLNPSDMVSGQQVYDLLKALAGDGYDFNFIGG